MALTVYKSSAGSGKTFTLVKEYLRLVITQPQDYSRILAITFTNKATEEMKHRILEALLQLANGEDSDYLPLLSKDLPRLDDKGIRRRSEEAYELIIHNYSRFEVVTIDSFFSKVLKSFARELNLPLSYEVEMNTKLALREAIEELYHDIEDHPEIKQWLAQFAFDQMEDDKSWNVDRNILNLGENLFKEVFDKGLEGKTLSFQNLEGVRDQLKQEKAIFEKTLINLGRKALKLMDKHGLAISDFAYGKSSAPNTFNKFLARDFDIGTRFIKAANGEDSWYTKTSSKKEQIQGLLDDGFSDVAQEVLAYHEAHIVAYRDALALLKNMYGYGLLEKLHQQLKSYRDKHNVMLISDTNSILRKVLQQADAPIIFEKLGSHFKHLMIDEFQDTSDFQWKNLLPLVENSLSEGHEVLIVGDVKQSIYRFRGGNLNLLLRQIQKDLAIYYTQETEKVLADNYRSLSQIVAFNNALFSKLPQAISDHKNIQDQSFFELAYEGHQQSVKKGDGGHVCLRFYGTEEYEDHVLRDLVASMKHNKSMGYEYSDMLVLVNQKKHIFPVTDALMKADIRFVSDESLKLKSSLPVQFLLLLMRYLNSYADEVLLLELIIHYQRLQQKIDFAPVHTNKENRMSLEAAGFPADFISRQHELKQQALFDLVCELLLIFDFEAQSDLYLQQFLDLVLEQSQKGKNSINAFLEWWENDGVNQNVNVSSNKDAVQILTIHKAKGLQSPLVFVPFADWYIQPKRSYEFWTDQLPEAYQALRYFPLSFSERGLVGSSFTEAFYQESAENAMDTLNKAYVAFTRPEHKLYVFSKDEQKGSIGINKLLRSLTDEINAREVGGTDHVSFVTGEDHPKPIDTNEKKHEEKANTILKVYPKVSFLDQLHIRNDSERFFMLQETKQAQDITLGNQVHDVLSGIGTKEDLPTVIQQRKQSGELSAEAAQKVQRRVEQLFEHPEISRWFVDGYEVFNERVLWYEGREHKPDRLMLKKDEAIVIDYKKDKEDISHERQVQRYMQALQALGYAKVLGYLIYVEPVIMKEVAHA